MGRVRDAEFNDPRLVEVYDADCVSTRDDDYFAALLDETCGNRVLDVGCGTGRLALRLAAAGHTVTGIDPSAAALSAAQSKAGAGCVTWMHGSVEAAAEGAFDVALMTGHVSQFLLREGEWVGALRAIRRALRSRGRLAFHAYDPSARIWERWNARDSRRQVAIKDGLVSIWTEVTNLDDDTVSFSTTIGSPAAKRCGAIPRCVSGASHGSASPSSTPGSPSSASTTAGAAKPPGLATGN